MSLKKTFLTNIIFSIGTQVISIIVSLIMTMGIPKVLSVKEYGYWQLFIFYVGFIGFFQVGLSDGLYLKYGGKNFEKINKQIVKSQLVYALIFQSFISLGILLYIFISDVEPPRLYIIAAFSLYIIIGNLITLLGFILLSTNNIIPYSKSVLIDKISFILSLCYIFFSNDISTGHLIILFISSKFLSLLFLTSYFRSFLRIRMLSVKKSFYLLKFTMLTGIVLMFSNVASTLILGVGRFVIDKKWDIATFGKVSLALSATYFFLLLISQVSLSLFPVLRKTNYDNQKKILAYASDFIGIIMLGVFILYFPLIFVLKMWIPQYSESFEYLIVLLPICLFEGKMQIIGTTYMKAINRQKTLLFINLFVLTLSIALSIVGGYIFHNILIILYSMLICLALRSILTQLFLYRFYDVVPDLQILVEVVYTIIFIFLVNYFPAIISLSVYILLYSFSLVAKRKRNMALLRFFLTKKKLFI